jgi:hypothetical protein
MKRHEHPQPVSTIVEQGRGVIVGHELSDGTYVKAGEPCCEDPTRCERAECWSPWPVPPKPRWWRR